LLLLLLLRLFSINGGDDDDVEADDLLERALSLQLSRRLEELRAEHDYLNERMKEGG